MYSNPVKDWFYFTRQQRKGMVVLTVIIFAIPLTAQFIEVFRQPYRVDNERFHEAVRAFEQQMARMESASVGHSSSANRTAPEESGSSGLINLHAYPFDPNTIDKEELVSMGVPAYLARSIMNYLAAGGRFRYKEDLQRLYLMEDAIYEQLEAYVLLPSRAQTKVDNTGGLQTEQSGDMPGAAATKVDKRTNTEKTVSRTMSSGTGINAVMVNISMADTTELMLIRGIGPVFSRRIVRYRELLGGYHCITQLQEVFGIDSLRFQEISNQVTADSIHIRKMDVNRVSYTDLVKHPYIDKRTATAIINLRDQHGPFTSAKEIKRSYIIDECLWQRLAHYFSPE